ncbi:DNA gyrase subunit A [Runella defluvii]|uniref:DNA gyrase subunit A n=1 Tax=Runella defluvii TaxID=370973 RepID=A0A7W5ZJD2_9BACT|nr:DNA gyrase subunit A [Runella defluvii]MBB3837923.1 DNA gyrase subunit A [Runella defluvii]
MSENTSNIIPINIEEEMRTAYIDYSMSVIISRALPDARDGLKPVHRRVLYAMFESGFLHNRPYKKSARTVGDVMAKYHPHGDSSIYDTMVRMAQPWSLRYPLIDGQGNFGSLDGDSPAAMRYTESRLKRIAEEMLVDINKDTVNFQPNYDDSDEEPSVLPAKLPNLLLNGSSGIAVGMATNMAPHNLTEVLDGTIAYIDNNDITVSELIQYVKAPDFPTGAIIYGYQGVRSAYETGRGRVVMRAVATFEQTKTGREQIVVTEIPYMVNKADMIKRIADLVNEKKLEGISAIRDESDREGVRIVFELKKDSIPNIVLNHLYKYTPLQSSFSINNVALVKGRPALLNLKDLIKYYVEHRLEVVTRRTQFELKEAEKRAHILQGLLIALDNLDAVISLIRSARDPETARNGLIEQFSLSEAQARAILDMRLQRLTGMERDKIILEYDELMKLIADLLDILANEPRKFQVIKDELAELRARYGDERRSKIEYAAEEFADEDMIADEEMLITISHQGYVKRTPLSEYRTQGRGGVGSRGVTTKDDDFTEHLFSATMLNYLLIFTEFGRLYWLKVYEIPEGSKVSKGRPIQNLINIESGDKVRAVINVRTLSDADYINNNYLIMCTESGTIKKTLLEAYSRPRVNGIIAISINEGDRLLDVALTNGDNEIVIASKEGKAVRFHESRVRPMGRTAAGVKGIELGEEGNNKAIGMLCVSGTDKQLLVVSENGYGKRSPIEDYRVTNRGAKGVTTLNITDKVGNLVAIKEVSETDDLMIINRSGIAIRMSVQEIRVAGRNTQGVRLIKLSDSDEISSVTRIEKDELEEEEGLIADNTTEAPESTETTE